MIYKIQDTTLEGIANAIRAKSGTNEDIQVEDFEYAILNIDTGENTVSAAESAKSAKESADSANTSELAAAEHAGRASVSESNAEEHADRAEAAAANAVAEVQELLNDEVAAAKTAANNAKTSETNAKNSANEAASIVKSTEDYAQSAAESAQVAQETIWDATGATSEAWAKGTMQGVEIASDHEAYHNNSKYWCDQAKLAAQDASSSAATANVYAQAEVTA